MATKVRATKVGFYKSTLRNPGEEFMLDDGMRLGKWMEPVGEGKPAPVKTRAGKTAPKPVKGKGDDSELA